MAIYQKKNTYQSVDLGVDETHPASAKTILLTSHAITKVGSKAWEFATPLLLLNFNPESLFAPVAFGLFSSVAKLLFGPMIGGWADRNPNRLSTVFMGCFMQGFTSAVSIFLLAALLHSKEAASSESAFGGMSSYGVLLFLALSFCGVLEALSANSVSVAIEKDWVPTVFVDLVPVVSTNEGGAHVEENDELTAVNTFMSRIDLVSEFVGPVLAGLVLTYYMDEPLIGFAVIGFGNAATFIPQYFLLKSLHNSCSPLRTPKEAHESGDNQSEKQSWIKEMGKAWPVWMNHSGGVPLVSISYALLYFTVLSPHGIPLTAYLASSGTVDPFQLSIFRGLGAIGGIVGLSTFEGFKQKAGLRTAANTHIWFEFLAVTGAAVTFSLGKMYWFMLCVVLSRVGLYGFDVGFMELQQRQVEEKCRNSIGAVDNSLTSFILLILYASTLHVESPEQFGRLTWASAFAVLLSSVLFSLYLCLWHEHEHTHDEGSEDSHPHTTQQLRALELSRTHKHVHYAGMGSLSPCGSDSVPAHDHSHDHHTIQHDHSHDHI